MDASATLGVSPSLALRKVLASPPLSLSKDGVRTALGLADAVAELILASPDEGAWEPFATDATAHESRESDPAARQATLMLELEALLQTAIAGSSEPSSVSHRPSSDDAPSNSPCVASSDPSSFSAPPPSAPALAYECVAACLADGSYAPRHERMRRGAGLSAERRLEDALEGLGAPFEDEAELRARGYVRTPDALLLAPLAIRGRPVCWIDSKACFGDPETHAKLLETQLQAYVDLFGPGAVVYWHGHVQGLSGAGLTLGGHLGADVVVLDGFPPPRAVLELLPELDLATGELVHSMSKIGNEEGAKGKPGGSGGEAEMETSEKSLATQKPEPGGGIRERA